MVYEGSKSATEQRMGQSQAEVATLAQEVLKLQEVLEVGEGAQWTRAGGPRTDMQFLMQELHEVWSEGASILNPCRKSPCSQESC